MIKEQNIDGKTHNGLLKGLVRYTCNKCFQGHTTTIEGHKEQPIERCIYCNSKNIEVKFGNKPLKTQQDYNTINKFNGGKLKMASEKVKKALQMLKEEGIDTNVVTATDKPADETTGEVGGEEEEEDVSTEEGLIIEKSDSGRGFQMYRDYANGPKFNRLSR